MRVERQPALVALASGAALVVTAVAAGVAQALVLRSVGVDLGFGLATSGPWLAGLGLAGEWQRSVDPTTPAGGAFTEAVRLAPFLVLLLAAAAGYLTARSARDRPGSPAGRLAEAVIAASTAAALTPGLAWATTVTTTTANDAGSVQLVRGLAPLLSMVGAAAVALVVHLTARSPVGAGWRPAWRDARAVLVVPGVVLVVVAAVAGTLVLQPGAGLAVLLLTVLPLTGAAALLVAGGAPVRVDASLLTPEPANATLFDRSPATGLLGLLVVLLLAAAVGWWRGRREPRWGLRALLATTGMTAAVALGVALLAGVVAVLPAGLGGAVELQVDPLVALLVGGLLGLVTATVASLASRRSPPDREVEPAERDDPPLAQHSAADVLDSRGSAGVTR